MLRAWLKFLGFVPGINVRNISVSCEGADSIVKQARLDAMVATTKTCLRDDDGTDHVSIGLFVFLPKNVLYHKLSF